MSGFRLRLDLSSGIGLDISSRLRLSASYGLEINSSSGLGLGTSSELNFLGRLRLNALVVGLGLGIWSGSLGNLEGNTGWYDLRKRPGAVADQIQMEEEQMDSADPVSH